MALDYFSPPIPPWALGVWVLFRSAARKPQENRHTRPRCGLSIEYDFYAH